MSDLNVSRNMLEIALSCQGKDVLPVDGGIAFE